MTARISTFYTILVVITGCMLWFPLRTIRLRVISAQGIEPHARGLSSVDQQFPGSASIIKKLSDEPYGVVLEAQGNAYDYTTFVSTLAGQPSYLGWTNHVTLLTKKYEEASRREKVTQQIYSTADCAERLALVKREDIQYVVRGALEKKKHPEAARLDFGCFTQLLQSGDFELFRP